MRPSNSVRRRLRLALACVIVGNCSCAAGSGRLGAYNVSGASGLGEAVSLGMIEICGYRPTWLASKCCCRNPRERM